MASLLEAMNILSHKVAFRIHSLLTSVEPQVSAMLPNQQTTVTHAEPSRADIIASEHATTQ